MSDNTHTTIMTAIITLFVLALGVILAVFMIKDIEIREREETARHTLCLESADPLMCIALSSKKGAGNA